MAEYPHVFEYFLIIQRSLKLNTDRDLQVLCELRRGREVLLPEWSWSFLKVYYTYGV